MEIELAILRHFQYIESVAAFIEGSGPEPELIASEDSAVAEWLEEHPDQAITDQQTKLYGTLADAVAAKKAGDLEKANALLDQAYTLYSQIERAIFANEERDAGA
ncbi:hypothetical protein [Oceanithermus sp.]|uniref:hypothetical protein n=1 Tax=Oceanithermus sp. TaxID=2268145 RepID=UPI0025CD04AA|nr:hypothetical protein [Oceanithermus sp.]